jgi:hypothetical protein
MGFIKGLWDAFGDIIDAKTEQAKTQKLQGFIGSMPIYGPRGPSVFLPEEKDDPICPDRSAGTGLETPRLRSGNREDGLDAA